MLLLRHPGRWLLPLVFLLAILVGAGAARTEAQSVAVPTIIKDLKPAVVLVESQTQTGMAWGTGFVVSSDGYIVTNQHVVADTQGLSVYLRNKDKLPAQVVKATRSDDLALLKVTTSAPLYTVRLGNDAIPEGTRALVTGYPLPPTLTWLGLSLDSSTTGGTLSGRRGSDGEYLPGPAMLQMDVPVSHGNSGSPVYLTSGEVVGVAEAAVNTQLGFAIPVSKVKQLLATAGVALKPRPAAPDAKDAFCPPGDLRLINVIPPSKELSPLFGRKQATMGQVRYDDYGVNGALGAYRTTFGSAPPLITSPTAVGDKIYMGGVDTTLYEYNTGRGHETRALVEAEQPFFFPAVANEQEMCVASGALTFNTQIDLGSTIVKNVAAGVVGAFTFGLGSLLFGGGAVTNTNVRGNGMLLGINRDTGHMDWEQNTGFLAAPILVGSRIVAGGMGIRAVYDLNTGKEVWKQEKSEGAGDTTWYCPGYADGSVIYGVEVPVKANRDSKTNITLMLGRGKARLASYSAGDGAANWAVDLESVEGRPRPLAASVTALPQEKELVVVLGGRVTGHQMSNGGQIWAYPAAATDKDAKGAVPIFTPDIAEDEGVVYVGSEDRRLYALNAKNGELLWKFPTRGAVGAPRVGNGVVYVGSADKYLYAVDAKTGVLQWKFRSGNAIRTRPLIKNRVVYFGNDLGEFYALHIPAQ